MNVPGQSFTIPVPVAHHDRPPEGSEALVFTYKPASEWDEQWVGIDLVDARSLYRSSLRFFDRLGTGDFGPPDE